jgi:hypothetical protein
LPRDFEQRIAVFVFNGVWVFTRDRGIVGLRFALQAAQGLMQIDMESGRRRRDDPGQRFLDAERS